MTKMMPRKSQAAAMLQDKGGARRVYRSLHCKASELTLSWETPEVLSLFCGKGQSMPNATHLLPASTRGNLLDDVTTRIGVELVFSIHG